MRISRIVCVIGLTKSRKRWECVLLHPERQNVKHEPERVWAGLPWRRVIPPNSPENKKELYKYLSPYYRKRDIDNIYSQAKILLKLSIRKTISESNSN